MQLRQQQKLRHNAQFLVRGAVFLLVSLTLVGCGGTPSNSTAPLRPFLTSSSCDTPPDVQPVSAAEIDIGDTSRPFIALTFDAGGPSAPTARILDVLAKHQAHSTFFITGEWANQNPDLVRRIHSEGHEIGNHTMHIQTCGRYPIKEYAPNSARRKM